MDKGDVLNILTEAAVRLCSPQNGSGMDRRSGGNYEVGKQVKDVIKHIRAESSRSPGCYPSTDDHRLLCKFYDVDTLDQLVDEQAKQIKKLQDQLRPHLPDFSNDRVPREG